MRVSTEGPIVDDDDDGYGDESFEEDVPDETITGGAALSPPRAAVSPSRKQPSSPAERDAEDVVDMMRTIGNGELTVVRQSLQLSMLKGPAGAEAGDDVIDEIGSPTPARDDTYEKPASTTVALASTGSSHVVRPLSASRRKMHVDLERQDSDGTTTSVLEALQAENTAARTHGASSVSGDAKVAGAPSMPGPSDRAATASGSTRAKAAAADKARATAVSAGGARPKASGGAGGTTTAVASGVQAPSGSSSASGQPQTMAALLDRVTGLNEKQQVFLLQMLQQMENASEGTSGGTSSQQRALDLAGSIKASMGDPAVWRAMEDGLKAAAGASESSDVHEHVIDVGDEEDYEDDLEPEDAEEEHKGASSPLPSAPAQGPTTDEHELSVRLLSTWGGASMVGLSEIEIYDEEHERVPLHANCLSMRGAGAAPPDSPQRRSLARVVDGHAKTTREAHMWLGNMPTAEEVAESGPLEVVLRLPSDLIVGKVRVWNYNKSLVLSTVGVKDAEILEDGHVVWKGEIRKAAGNNMFDTSTTVVLRELPPPPPPPLSDEEEAGEDMQAPAAARLSPPPPAAAAAAAPEQATAPKRASPAAPEIPTAAVKGTAPPEVDDTADRAAVAAAAAAELTSKERNSGVSSAANVKEQQPQTDDTSGVPLWLQGADLGGSSREAPEAGQIKRSVPASGERRGRGRRRRDSADAGGKRVVAPSSPEPTIEKPPDSDDKPADGPSYVPSLMDSGKRQSKGRGRSLEKSWDSLEYFERANAGRLNASTLPAPVEEGSPGHEASDDPSEDAGNPVAADTAVHSRKKAVTGPQHSPRPGQPLPQQPKPVLGPAPAVLAVKQREAYGRAGAPDGGPPRTQPGRSRLAASAASSLLGKPSDGGGATPIPAGDTVSALDAAMAAVENSERGTVQAGTEHSTARRALVPDALLDSPGGADSSFAESDGGELGDLARSLEAGGGLSADPSGIDAMGSLMDESTCAIPLMPTGQVLRIRVLSTWGDPHYVGLAGLDLFDAEGHLVTVSDPKTQLGADPPDINVLAGYGDDPRTVDNLMDGVNHTRDDLHVWLAPFNPGSEVTVTLTLDAPTTLSMLRIWNYNKSRIHSYRGARRVSIDFDGVTIFEGEVRKAPGTDAPPEDCSEVILFTGDEELLTAIEQSDVQVAAGHGQGTADPTMGVLAMLRREFEAMRPRTAGNVAEGEVATRPVSEQMRRRVRAPAPQQSYAEVFAEEKGKAVDDDGERPMTSASRSTAGIRASRKPGKPRDSGDDGSVGGLDELLDEVTDAHSPATSPALGESKESDGGDHLHGSRALQRDLEEFGVGPPLNDGVLLLPGVDPPRGRRINVYITETWGDQFYVGLSGVAVLAAVDGCARQLELQRSQLDADPLDINVEGHTGDVRTLDKVIDGVNVTTDDLHMWLLPYTAGYQHVLSIDLGREYSIAGLRFWNYNKSADDVRRGVRTVEIAIDGTKLNSGPVSLRKAPGHAAFDFGQSIAFDGLTAGPPKDLAMRPSKVAPSRHITAPVRQDYETPLFPCGSLFKFVFETTWGDPYYIGLNGIEFFDADGARVPVHGDQVYAIPASVNDILRDGERSDVRLAANLVRKTVARWDDRRAWLAPLAHSLMPGQPNLVYVCFDHPVTLSMIRFWNYSKRPERGARTVEIWIDDTLVFWGGLRRGMPPKGAYIAPPVEKGHTTHDGSSDYSQPVLFTHDAAVIAAEKGKVPYCGETGQDVMCINERKVVAASEAAYMVEPTAPGVQIDLAARPTTSLV